MERLMRHLLVLETRMIELSRQIKALGGSPSERNQAHELTRLFKLSEAYYVALVLYIEKGRPLKFQRIPEPPINAAEEKELKKKESLGPQA